MKKQLFEYHFHGCIGHKTIELDRKAVKMIFKKLFFHSLNILDMLLFFDIST